MINWVLRAAVLLWAALFTIVGVQGLIDPMSYVETFQIGIEGVAANTVRADLSSFFLVASAAGAIGALLPGWTRALLVPAALFGAALVGRIFGVAIGDAVDPSIFRAMIIEALTVGLMVGSWWILSRPTGATDPAVPSFDPGNDAAL